MITFSYIPTTLKVPGAYAEFDVSGSAGLQTQPKRTLIFGTMLTAGTATALSIELVGAAAEAKGLFGEGSMLHHMVERYRQQDPYGELWVMPLAEAGGGVVSTRDVTFTGTATASGTLFFYIGGRVVPVAVTSGDAAADVASAFDAAVTADGTLPLESSAALGVTTLDCKWKGETGNAIRVELNRLPGQKSVAGITVSIGAVGSGATDPTLSTAIAALPVGKQFTTIICPYTDTTSIAALESELAARWQAPQMIPAQTFIGYDDTLSNTVTYTSSRNSPHIVLMGCYAASSPPWEWAAGVAGAEAKMSHPGVPRRDIPLAGLMGPPDASLWDFTSRNTALQNAISTFTVVAGVPYIERLVTMYQQDAGGNDDDSLSSHEKMRVLAEMSYSWRRRMTSQFPQSLLADDDSAAKISGAVVISPKIARNATIELAEEWISAGWMQDLPGFKDGLVVEINSEDSGRLDFILPPKVIDQLWIVAAKISPVL